VSCRPLVSEHARIAHLPPSAPARCHRLVEAEQAYLEIGRPVNDRAVGLEPAIGNPEHQLGTHHPLDVDSIDDLPHGREDLTGEFQFPEPQCAPLSGRTEPTEKKPQHLPKCIDAQAAWHDRIALEMARKEPKIGFEVEDGADQAFTVFTACIRYFG